MAENKMVPSVWTDERVEKLVGTLLLTGVLISGLVVFVGGVLYMLKYGRDPVRYADFDPQQGSLHSIVDVGKFAVQGDGRAIIEIGLLLLIATPVLRVAFSLVAFSLEKDRLYAALTLIVLVILLLSLFGRVS
jgi:uncharacterized membrane protein